MNRIEKNLTEIDRVAEALTQKKKPPKGDRIALTALFKVAAQSKYSEVEVTALICNPTAGEWKFRISGMDNGLFLVDVQIEVSNKKGTWRPEWVDLQY